MGDEDVQVRSRYVGRRRLVRQRPAEDGPDSDAPRLWAMSRTLRLILILVVSLPVATFGALRGPSTGRDRGPGSGDTSVGPTAFAMPSFVFPTPLVPSSLDGPSPTISGSPSAGHNPTPVPTPFQNPDLVQATLLRGTNVLVNSDAEQGACSQSATNPTPVPGWTSISGAPQQLCYGASDFPDAAQGPQAPDTPGRSFFMGGETAMAALTQSVDLSSGSSIVDRGSLTFTLSGWLGGWTNQNDRATVTVSFVGSGDKTLATAGLAPVTSVDRDDTTGFLKRTTTGTVPVGCRKAVLTLTFVRDVGMDNDGYVDSLVLKFD